MAAPLRLDLFKEVVCLGACRPTSHLATFSLRFSPNQILFPKAHLGKPLAVCLSSFSSPTSKETRAGSHDLLPYRFVAGIIMFGFRPTAFHPFRHHVNVRQIQRPLNSSSSVST